MSIEIPDSMKNIHDKKASGESNQYRSAAKEYAEQGFDEVMISELLELEGCSRESSKKLANDVLSERPDGYQDGNPPTSYYDVIDNVKETLVSARIESIEEYFTRFGSSKTKLIPNRIMLARDNPIGIMFDEIHKELEPIVDGLIIESKVIAQNEEVPEPSDKELMEQELFGVWPPQSVKRHAAKEKAENKLATRTKPKGNDVPLFY